MSIFLYQCSDLLCRFDAGYRQIEIQRYFQRPRKHKVFYLRLFQVEILGI
uniref:Uncharacterized protein n=1 Tax=Candidatus Kentrum sp. UNK TaxID=2126344 RepID=A0A451AUB3_9GAMM|nr:MAG: hypothetical protein BECKUNK1418G_GA0071005_10556 [Candidatus Kentron sp. UNK]VFK69646.1 MAG: hypothetical protein BECKUNK1418H_GA0071006_101720 [Candidatus Kentron sp. UNK]